MADKAGFLSVWRRIFTVLGAVLVLASCTHTSELSLGEAYLNRAVKIALPQPDFKKPLYLEQLLTVSYGDARHSLVVLLDANERTLRLSALSPLGVRLFQAALSDGKLEVESLPIADKLPPAEQVLLDILLSLCPAETFAEVLPQGWQLTDEGQVRFLYDAEGLAVYRISYEELAGERLPVKIEHEVFRYVIELEYLE